MLKKGDIVLILFVGVIVCVSILWNNYKVKTDSSEKIAVVMHEGKVIKKIQLNHLNSPENIEISKGIKIRILAEKGRIRFLESNCRDKICVKTGYLTKKGDKAVCLPSKTVIMILGNEGQADSISY